MKPIAYVAGPYSARTTAKRNANIAQADAAGRELLALGYAPIVPHNNTAAWEEDGRFEHADFLGADLALLRHCHILVLVGEWRNSPGVAQELALARDYGLTIYGDVSCVLPASEHGWDAPALLIEDILERTKLGVSHYGGRLYPGDGRDSRRDTYEELVDAAVYKRKELSEAGG